MFFNKKNVHKEACNRIRGDFPEGKTPISLTILFAALTLLVGASTVAMFLTGSLHHDEQTYIAASVIFDQYRIYTEFTYNHLPNLPILYNFIYKLTGTDQYFLTGRIIQIIFGTLSVFTIWLIAQKYANSSCVGWLSAILFLTSPTIIFLSTYVNSTQIIPIGVCLLGVYFLLFANEAHRWRPALYFVSGSLISLAAGFRVSYIFIVIATSLIVMILAFRRPLANNLMNILLPFAAGGLIAGFPTLFYVVRDFESFMFNNLYYFESQIEFRRSAEGSVGVYAMTLKEKLAYAQRIWAQGPNVIIMVCTSAAVIAAAMTPGFRDRQVQLRRPAFGLAILAFIGATVMSFQVTPMWPQYLIPQMVMAIVLGAAAFGTLDASARRYATSTLVATALVAVLTMPTARLTVHLPKMFDRDQWTGVAVHRGAAELRRQMRIAGFDDPATRIATLAPILPLEAGFSIFNELASGPFFYRSGNFMTAEQRAQFNVVSMDTIEDFLTEHRPAAVLVGAYEPTRPEYFTEVPLIRFAEEAGYRRVDLGPFPGGNILYLRPAAAIDAHGQTDVDRSPGA